MMDLNPSEPVWQKQKAEEWYPPSDLAVRLVQINSLRENWLYKPIELESKLFLPFKAHCFHNYIIFTIPY